MEIGSTQRSFLLASFLAIFFLAAGCGEGEPDRKELPDIQNPMVKGSGPLNNSVFPGPGLDPPLENKWEKEITPINSFVEDSLLIGAVETGIFTYNMRDKSESWKIKYSDNSDTANASKDVYYFSTHRNVYAVDAIDQHIEWRVSSDRRISNPTLYKGVIYYGDKDGIVALNSVNGNKLWKFDPNSKYQREVEDKPVVTDSLVYTVNSIGDLYAIDRRTGEKEWEAKELEGYPQHDDRSRPTDIAYGHENVYVTLTSNGKSKYLYAIDAKTGGKKWKFYAGVTASPPVVSDDFVYVSTTTEHPPRGRIGSYPDPADTTYALNPEGEVAWKQTVDYYRGNTPSPIYSDGVLYVMDGPIYAFDGQTGREKWSQSVPHPETYSNPDDFTIHRGTLYAFYRDEKISAWK